MLSEDLITSTGLTRVSENPDSYVATNVRVDKVIGEAHQILIIGQLSQLFNGIIN